MTVSPRDINPPRKRAVRAKKPRKPVAILSVVEDSDEPLPTEDGWWLQRPWLAWCDRTGRARGAAREALLGVLLARTAAEVSPLVKVASPVGSSGTNLDLFVFLVGASGTTKTLANAMLRDARCWSAEIYKPGSGEGLAAAYVHVVKVKDENGQSAPHLVQHAFRRYGWVDEYGSLVAVRQRAGQTLDSELRSAWSGERLGFDYRAAETRLLVEPGTYRLGLAAGIQPAIAGEVFKGADVGDLQRWVWFSTTDAELSTEGRGPWEPMTDEEWAVPANVCTDPTLFEKHAPGRTMLPITKAIEDEVYAAHIARQSGAVHDNDAHRNQTRLRIAGLCALLDGHMTVSDDDWRLAGEILDRSDANRAVVSEYLATSARAEHRARGRADEERADAANTARIERVAVRIWNVVAQHDDESAHGAGTCTRACASRILESATRDYMDAALAFAEERRWLVVTRETTTDSVKGKQDVLRLARGKARPAQVSR